MFRICEFWFLKEIRLEALLQISLLSLQQLVLTAKTNIHVSIRRARKHLRMQSYSLRLLNAMVKARRSVDTAASTSICATLKQYCCSILASKMANTQTDLGEGGEAYIAICYILGTAGASGDTG